MADATTNYSLPTEDARFISLEDMVKEGFTKIDAVLKDSADRVEALELAAEEE